MAGGRERKGGGGQTKEYQGPKALKRNGRAKPINRDAGNHIGPLSDIRGPHIIMWWRTRVIAAYFQNVVGSSEVFNLGEVFQYQFHVTKPFPAFYRLLRKLCS